MKNQNLLAPLPVLLLTAAILAGGEIAATANQKTTIPEIPGLQVSVGEIAPIPGTANSILHQFEDGRIVVTGESGQGIWSEDGGQTWKPGARGPDDKTTINLGDGEVLSIARTPTKRDDGKFRLPQRRSHDNWETVSEEEAVVDTPLAVSTGGDDGSHHDGLLMHHGAILLKNGDLLATTYGNYKGDTELADGYPEEFRMTKYRTVALFSPGMGKTWGNPITVAYDRQLGRATDPDQYVQTTMSVPAVTQEGFCEADLTRAKNGTLVCAMRSGGRIGVKKAPIYPTPLYVSLSKDEGKTWALPVPVADRGVCPYLVTLDNGVIVCSYSRPGAWLIFSDDDGETWKGAFEFAPGDGYVNIVETAPNKILAIYKDDSGCVGTFFTVERSEPLVESRTTGT